MEIISIKKETKNVGIIGSSIKSIHFYLIYTLIFFFVKKVNFIINVTFFEKILTKIFITFFRIAIINKN